MLNVKVMVAGVIACALAFGSAMGGEFDLQRAEFEKYYREITGKDAPKGTVRFAIDPKVSKSGRDAYRIVTTASVQQQGVTITGSNTRSVWYGLYDLLERRGGCHWFWDGDVVPKRDSIDLSNLDVHEEARFEYRGLRYFAHRGLTRFQAEHWGPEDWKKEIDWILKRRLNVFMLRIGQDDLFQRAFPDTCAYPDPAKPLPGTGVAHDDRTLFWSLQYRGKLRDNLQKYAFARGLMVPEDFGTMTHWYSRTPEDFLAKKKPDFIPLANKGKNYQVPNAQVWNIRDDKWVDEYWKMTKTAVESYGRGAPEPRLLHTIGLGERRCYKDKKKNFDMKILALDKFLAKAHTDYPDAKVLLAGWDFYLTWHPDEVKALLPRLDPKRDIIWDYEGDLAPQEHKSGNWFGKWGLVGHFPYTYSMFLAYENALDVRANYPLIEERQKIVQNDPFCKGYILWPESSHTDTLGLRFFTANAWSAKPVPHGDVLDEFCASRYGDYAERMKAAWKAAIPASYLRAWGSNYGRFIVGKGLDAGASEKRIRAWTKPVEEACAVFSLLSDAPWDDAFVRRDAIDLARMVLDRLIALRAMELCRDIAAWRKGGAAASAQQQEQLAARAETVVRLCDLMADLLALHTDYSLWESYQRLDAVEKIQNPNFSKTLFENASCPYCRSHQYELARHWYAPHARKMADRLAKAVASGDRAAKLSEGAEAERLALKAKPLESLKPTLPRTQENFRKVMREIMSALVACPYGTDAGMDLYLLVGQSNMAGRGILTAENRVETDRIFKLDAKGKWQVADEPIHFDKKVAGAGLAASFARTMADRDKNVKIGLIPCAVGGTRIDRWVEGGDLWSNAVARTRIALKSGTLKGILWHQGEGDADPSRAHVWGAKLKSMIKSFRREFGDVPFVAGELGWYLENFKVRGKPGYKPLWREINAQLHALEGKVPNFRVVSAEGLGANRDILHFNTEALREFGRRFAAAFSELAEAEQKEKFALQRAEFAKYYKQITGKDAPDGAVRFAIDSKLSNSGRDAYWIASCDGNAQAARCTSRTGCQPVQVTITGSNLRSVWYGLYDLLERRGGCHWFWDGDVVPKRDSIDLSNLDVHEEAHFEYRAIRYFAHRGLTRFQAEHWGLDDWKKEIDWILKRRLNTFMLRIGQDDVFQRAFPDVCPYPDASKPQPGMYKGYNDRTLFWSLQFRGQLRHDLQKYAFDRGLMSPEDFGTMSHWYSPTPDSFLANKKPPFLPQANSTHAEPHLRVWDIRTGDWAEEYWKLTKTAIDAYDQGAPEPRLLHTIGLGERWCYKDRKANFDLKVKTLNQFLDMAKRDYPDAKLLIAGWDFYCCWKNEEVREYLKTLDKDRVLLWDYEADDAKRGAKARNFTNWDVIGKFPYTYSIFLAYEKALDTRANYEIIEERQKLVQNDPFCKGYILWPESSHTDTLLLRFFTANAWSDKLVPHGDVLDEFCASRYGASAETMKAAWKAALPASWLRAWGNNYSYAVLGIGGNPPPMKLIDQWKQPVEDAQKVFTLLQQVPWDDPFVQRDAIDIARMVLDRLIAVRVWEFGRELGVWRTNTTASVQQQDVLLAKINRVAELCDAMADLLALHTDYSLWESYQRLDAVEKIRNPAFEKTLFENASCDYCRSHQYELARYWYAPHVKAVAAKLAKAVAAGDRKADISVKAEKERLALKARPLESLKPTLPRTAESFRRVLGSIVK